ncbi:MAG: hypothetical protein DBP02_02015 [gamma proteobacterium symbiont of Ctena orbiculata]|nr:MAG: hypothetical protein DBP02_02015 [gamma proteobacterium symbiont of Ctena orbiculata]
MDIQEIVSDLIESGLSEGAIAEMIGEVSQPTIHRIKTGEIKNTSYKIGSALVALHEQVCGQPKDAA